MEGPAASQASNSKALPLRDILTVEGVLPFWHIPKL